MAGPSPPLLPRSALRLGFLSLLPLVISGLVSLSRDFEVGHLGGLAFAVYAAVLLSFLGGVRCGFELMRTPHTPDARRLWFSALPALGGWALALFIALVPQAYGAGAAFAGLYALQSIWDRRSAVDAGAPDWYPVLRQVLTGGVMLACMLLPFATLLRAMALFPR